MTIKALLPALLPAAVVVLALLPQTKKSKPFHTPTELAAFERLLGDPGDSHLLPIDSSILFPVAKTCGGCHGYDPLKRAMITTSGVDVNVYDDWRSSMMANSARDPFWRAKVSHEILVNPSHSIELQDKCTSCHAPAGHFQAKLHDHQAHYSLAEAMTDSLALDGVTCQACHAQAPGDLGSRHSGNMHFDTNYIRVAYGPYEMAFEPPMHQFVGITPKYGAHVESGTFCAACHTLITNSVDNNGVLTGTTFTEQATYHEWLNSRYDEQHDNISCQACHIPRLQDEIIISANYQFLTPKFPFGVHELAGANVTMLKVLRDNRDALGITAAAEHFDSTIAATLRMLQQQSLDIALTPVVTHGDTAYFDLLLKNKAGHKFPSGYPARRAWVELVVTNQNGQEVFHSGKLNPDGRIEGEDATVEPHYQVISRPDQVQIYELTPGDINGQFTNVLERCYQTLKDNRLVPEGFKLADPAYDTTQIIGNALNDPDFNHNINGQEGSGADILHFHIPVNGFTGTWTVKARVWYQSLPMKWMAPIFEYSSPEIDAFKTMFDQADQSPVLIAAATVDAPVSPVGTYIPAISDRIGIYPTLAVNHSIKITSDAPLLKVRVWDNKGKLVWDKPTHDVILPKERGVYWVEVITVNGRKVEKIVAP